MHLSVPLLFLSGIGTPHILVKCYFGIIEGQGVIPFKYLVLVAISAISDTHITCLMNTFLLYNFYSPTDMGMQMHLWVDI